MTSEEIKDKDTEQGTEQAETQDTFWKRHGADIGLAILVIYVILLAIGTVAEIFEIDSILNWWIFRPPGRQ